MLQRPANHKCATGMTLIEVMIAAMVLAIGIMSAMSALISVSTLETANHDDLIAISVAKQKLAEIQTQKFQTVFSFYGPNGQQNKFDVYPLPEGQGKIEFPTNPAIADNALPDTSISYTLSEMVNNSGLATDLGMPMDLDGDGLASKTDVTTTYVLLPMRITITWNSSVGPRSMKLCTMLVKTN